MGFPAPLQIQLTPTSQGPVWQANSNIPTVTLLNQDTTNFVYIGNSTNIQPGGLNTAPIQPGGSIQWPGTQPIYAVAPNGTQPLLIVPGSVGYSPGGLAIVGNVNATVSGNVGITGTPNVNVANTANVDITAQSVTLAVTGLTTTLQNVVASQAITPGTAITYPLSGVPISVQDYTSINLTSLINSSSPGTAGNAITALVNIFWYDDAGGTAAVDQESGIVYAGNSVPNSVPWYANLPARGQYCLIQIINFSTAGNLNSFGFRMTGSFRTPVRSSWYSAPLAGQLTLTGVTIGFPQYAGAVTGETGGFQQYFGNLDLGNIVTVTPGVGLHVYVLPLFSGKVWWQYSINTANLNNVPTLVDLAYVTSGNLSAGTAQPGIIWQGPNAFPGLFQGEIVLPRSPVGLVVNPAATSQIMFAMTGTEL